MTINTTKDTGPEQAHADRAGLLALERLKALSPSERDAVCVAVARACLEHGLRLMEIFRLADDDRAHVARLFEMMRPPRGARIVDMGSGFGEVARHMQKLDPGLSFVLVDHNEAWLDESPAQFEKRHADFRDTGLPGGCADVVMFCQSLGYAELRPALLEAHRLLVRGGVLFIWDFAGRDDGMLRLYSYPTREAEEIVGAAEGCGFLTLEVALLERASITDARCPHPLPKGTQPATFRFLKPGPVTPGHHGTVGIGLVPA